MAVEIEKFITETLDKFPPGHPERKFLEGQARAFARFNARETKAAAAVELNLEAEWSRQIRKFIAFGFHQELGLPEQGYLDSLPKFEPQPGNFRGRFDIPVLVETRISVKRQCELAGVDYFLGDLSHGDWPKDPEGYKTPDSPYITWMQDGAKNVKKSVERVRKELAQDERGGTDFDGIAFYIIHPEVLGNHFIDLPGTLVESGHAPSLGLWVGRPKLYYYWVVYAHPGFGSLSCGRL